MRTTDQSDTCNKPYIIHHDNVGHVHVLRIMVVMMETQPSKQSNRMNNT